MATGYIVLILFVVLVVLGFCLFIFGYSKGREKERKEQTAETLRKAESDRAFEKEKENIREEIYGNAANEKAQLSSGSGRERFNNINSSLGGTTPEKKT